MKQVKVQTTEKKSSNLFQSPYLSKDTSFSVKKGSFLVRNSNLDTPNYRISIKKKKNHPSTQQTSTNYTEGSFRKNEMMYYDNFNQMRQANKSN